MHFDTRAAIAVVLLSTACTHQVPESEPSSQGAGSSGGLPAGGTVVVNGNASVGVPGFVFSPSSSKFRLGAFVASDLVGAARRLTGAEGVITTLPSGATLSVPNADAPSLLAPPLTTDPSVHSLRVVQYFLGAGLPQDQMGDVHVNTDIRGSGTATAQANELPTFVAYTTVVDRKFQGIRVAGSHAYARFNRDDDVVEEQVFWPPIPAGVLADARALAATMNDVTAVNALVAQMPGEVRALQREVVIHHSTLLVDSVKAFASVDVSDPSLPDARSFDANGKELFLSDLLASPSTTPR